MRRCDCISHHQVWCFCRCLQPLPLVSGAPALRLTPFCWPMPGAKPTGEECPLARRPLWTKISGRLDPPPQKKKMSFIDPDQTCDIMCLSFLLLQTDLSAYNNVTAFLAPGVVGSFFLSHPAQQTRHFKRLTFHSFSDWLTDGSAGWEAVERASRWCACHRLSFSFPRLAATVVCRLRSRPDFRLWHEQRAFTLEKRTKHSCVISHSQRLMLFHSTCRSLRQ